MARQKSETKQFPGQHPGEKLELVFRQHVVVMRRPLLFGLVIIALSEIPLLALPPERLDLAFKILGVGIFVTLLVWFYYWIGWHYSVYILTDNRLIDIHQKGFFNRKVAEVGLDKVQSINYHIKGFQASVFKFGDINMQTLGGNWVMKSVSHPAEVHSRMMDVMREIGSTPPQT